MNGKRQSGGNGANGGSHASSAVDLDTFLSEVSVRLATADSAPVWGVEYDALVEPVARTQVVVFTMGGLLYAVDVGYVGDVMWAPHIAPISDAPDWVLGATNFYGDAIPVIDLLWFLGIGSSADWRTESVIVMQAPSQRVGLTVDSVGITYTFPIEQVIAPPFGVEAGLAVYLRGVVERDGEFIRVLDCERLLLGQEMRMLW